MTFQKPYTRGLSPDIKILNGLRFTKDHDNHRLYHAEGPFGGVQISFKKAVATPRYLPLEQLPAESPSLAISVV